MITRFLFSSPEGDISLTQEDLERPLLISPSTPHPFLTLGDYFNAARGFLLEDHLACFLNALHRPPQEQPPREDQIRTLLIRSEKQGALYHVASVEVEGKGTCAKFSLVTAMTGKSKEALKQESITLSLLNRKHPSCGLPQVYCMGDREIVRDSQKKTLFFLLGEWLEGYHEWHMLRDDAGKMYLQVWDQQQGYYTAGKRLFFELFRQAARTLTLLFDPETARQVRPWSHAAGDFIIRNAKGTPSVRLTTARGYEPLLTLPGHHSKKNLANLLFFFLDLGLRMRLDRLDGVGEMIWIEGNILPAVTQGFFEALTMMIDQDSYSKTIAGDFLDLLRSFSPEELTSAFRPLLEIYRDGGKEELRLIKKHLRGQVEELSSIIEKFPVSDRVSGSR
jgi:hypothetical protein